MLQNNFFCKSPYINLYDKPSYNSKISSQILYGEKFRILLKKNKFIKVKTSYDNYIGYIKSSNYINKFRPTHKISVLKSRIFKYPKNLEKYRSKKFLSFSSKIQIIKKNKNFVMFDKNKWLNIKDTKLINQKEIDFLKILKLFLKCKYKWGGKTFSGIDCSALVQIFYQYNEKYMSNLDNSWNLIYQYALQKKQNLIFQNLLCILQSPFLSKVCNRLYKICISAFIHL